MTTQRTTDTLTAHGITMTIKQWSRRNKISVSTIKYRLRRGVDPARAVDPRPLPRSKHNAQVRLSIESPTND